MTDVPTVPERTTATTTNTLGGLGSTSYGGGKPSTSYYVAKTKLLFFKVTEQGMEVVTAQVMEAVMEQGMEVDTVDMAVHMVVVMEDTIVWAWATADTAQAMAGTDQVTVDTDPVMEDTVAMDQWVDSV